MAKYKLIIIDDEFLVVKGLKETVDWASLDVEVVATASDGNEGLRLIRLHKPDLVISDIRMPKCDGLNLAEHLARDNADCALIIYSGYSDFDYVSKAMEFGAVRYILKPIDGNVLKEKVREVLVQLEQKREGRKAVEQYRMGLPLLKSELITKLLEGDDAGEAESGLKRLGIVFPPCGVVIECAPISDDKGAMERVYKKLLASLESFLTVGHEYKTGFVIVTSLEDTEIILERARAIVEGETHDTGERLSLAVSEPYGHGKTLQQAYESAKTLRENFLFCSLNNVVAAGGNSGDFKSDKLIAAALDMIAKRYAEKLSVKAAAEELYVSESHLMHRFKDVLGKTFNDCLTEYRMQKARELILRGGGNYRIKEIAVSVGYGDHKYFSQLFREYFGMTPSEYAERYGK